MMSPSPGVLYIKFTYMSMLLETFLNTLLMQRLRLLYTQLLMQAAFFQLQSASKLKVSDSTRDEVEVYNTIPHNVQCTPIVLEHDTPIKICKAGSVGLDNSTINALALQRLVSYGRELCKTQIIGSHNSALTLADGYGASDHAYVGKSDNDFFRTSSQYFSILDQLQLGVRFLELDVHYVANDIRIAHCNVTGKSGCEQLYNGQAPQYFKQLHKVLDEIAKWLLRSNDQVVFVYFDGDEDLYKGNILMTISGYINGSFAESQIYRPSDRPENSTTWPTTLELLAMGKRIMFLTRFAYEQDVATLFLKTKVCTWNEPPLPLNPYPKCWYVNAEYSSWGRYGSIDRLVSSELQFGVKNSDGEIGPNRYILNELNLPDALTCGVNVVSPDNITPARMQSMVWTLAPGSYWNYGDCLVFCKEAALWQAHKCVEIPENTAAACQNGFNPLQWKIVGTVASLSDATELCDSQSGFYENDNAPMLFSIPATAYENMQLIEAVSQTSYEFVLLNTDVLYL
ncbi:unnamed protein product [Albugo candida]|uniref:Phosphatidylinositol-specific phospholipase C X domain-containing protein n=1 Tax=Albugo candida TaxID=65357 RepID=A0A024GMD5_9STRA|nr:unnamed protein product [Albugo candida]|eukprot:CCI47907.1 unnamed protein product [Albugo candida]